MKKSISIIISLLLAIPIWSRDYNIVTQGKAIDDGKTLNTKIIQSAIDQLSKEGGGRIIFSKRFLSHWLHTNQIGY